MNLANKRIYEHSQAIMEDALQSFVSAYEKNKALNKDALSAMIADEEGNEAKPYICEVVSQIEDFANIIAHDGFDINAQKYLTIAELSDKMERFVNQTVVDLEEGKTAKLSKDLSMSGLGFVISQTITRLVSQMEYNDLEAWMMVSRDLVMPEGSVIYNVVVGNTGHATSRVAEGGEFKTFSLESTEDYIKTSRGKVGIMVTYSEEAAERAGVSAIKMLTEAAIADIKRFKTWEAVSLLEANAKTTLDGLDPQKMPSGRSFLDLKKQNGTLLMRDFEKFFCQAQSDGFNIDTIFVHPLALSVFYREPAIKEYMEKSANILYFVPKKRETIMQNLLTKLTKKTTGTTQAALGESFQVPQLIANKQLNIVVTPIVSFHNKGASIMKPETRFTENPVVQHEAAPETCTDILLIDSSRALTHCHNGRGIISDKIEDRLVDVTRIKFKTYYSFLVDRDPGIFAFRNITVTDDVYDPYQKLVVTAQHSDLFPSK